MKNKGKREKARAKIVKKNNRNDTVHAIKKMYGKFFPKNKNGTWKYKYSVREVRFVGRYLSNGLDGTRAYKEIYNTTNTRTAYTHSSRLLNSEKILGIIAQFLDEELSNIKKDIEYQIIKHLKVQAFYRPSMFYNLDGSQAVTTWEEIPEDYHCCVEAVGVRHVGEREIPYIKLVDRRDAIETLAKYVQLFKEAEKTVHGVSDEHMARLHKIFYGEAEKREKAENVLNEKLKKRNA